MMNMTYKIFFMFVMIPRGRIGNPIGLETDLEKQSREGIDVKVYICPK
jgi:hypothetical protein